MINAGMLPVLEVEVLVLGSNSELIREVELSCNFSGNAHGRWAREILEDADLTGLTGRVSLVMVSDADLGFHGEVNTEQRHAAALATGVLEICPVEVVASLATIASELPELETIAVAMKPVAYRENQFIEGILYITKADDGVLIVKGYYANPKLHAHGLSDKWLYRRL